MSAPSPKTSAKIILIDSLSSFLGFKLADYFLEQNTDVEGLSFDRVRVNNLDRLSTHKNFSLLSFDHSSQLKTKLKVNSFYIFSLYERMLSTELTVQNIDSTLNDIENILENINKLQTKIIFVIPKKILLEVSEKDIFSIRQKVKRFLSDLEEKNYKLIKVYLPLVASADCYSDVYPNKYFKEIDNKLSLSVPQDTGVPLDVISLSDGLYALVKIESGYGLKKVAVDGVGTSLLTSARQIGEQIEKIYNKTLAINFGKSQLSEIKFEDSPYDEFIFSPKESWGEIVLTKVKSKSFLSQITNKPAEEKVEPVRVNTKKRRNKIHIKKTAICGGLLVVMLLIVPAILMMATGFIGFKKLEVAGAELYNQKIGESAKNANLAKGLFEASQKFANFYYPLFWISGQTKIYKGIVDGQSAAIYVSDSIAKVGQIEGSVNGITDSIIGDKNHDLRAEVSKSLSAIDLVLISLNKSNLYLSLSSSNINSPLLKPRLERLIELTDKSIKTLESNKMVIAALPEIVGVDSSKKYLILFLNNAELRPGGGFIGSYGLVTFEKGRLVDTIVEDVYTADGQLKTKLSPPAPLKEQLKVDNFYLRDSNFSPNYPDNAKLASDLILNSIGAKVDGVMAMDLTFVEGLLQIAGPVKLTGFDNSVSGADLFEKGTKYSELNFFPGSTQKKDFLSGVGDQLIDKIFSKENKSWPQTITLVSDSLKKRHIQIYFKDESLASLARFNNWDGVAPLSDLVKSDNYLMISEANLGINKVNRFIKRSIDLASVIDRDGFVLNRLVITLENQNTSSSWPAGSYIAYLRVFVPPKSTLAKVDMAGETDLKSVGLDGFKNTLVFFKTIEIPPGQKKTYSFEYRLDKALEFKDGKASFKTFIQKQPGTLDDTLNLRLDYPSYLNVLKSDYKKDGQSLMLSTDLSVDQHFETEFVKK